MPSVGRKFLVAGKGGLNFTNVSEKISEAYSGTQAGSDVWGSLLGESGAEDFREWARELGVESIAKPNGRVYPAKMKAAPMLRRWVQKLKAGGGQIFVNHRLAGIGREVGGEWRLDFETPEGRRVEVARAVVLAMGGGSWPQTGSDGKWQEMLQGLGVGIAPLHPANCGWDFAEPVFGKAAGMPLKNIVARCGDIEVKGEILVTDTGLEGGAIYRLTPFLRGHPLVTVDLKPAFSRSDLLDKMQECKRFHLEEAFERCRVRDCGKVLMESHPLRETWKTAEEFVSAVKALPFPLARSRPLDEAISSAGGVCWSGLDENLMLRELPGIFLAGEMIDWEAPTGGYLLQGCFSTGTRAGRGAAAWARRGMGEGSAEGRMGWKKDES